jgi:cytochrome c biogenesis protein ResB
MLQRLHLTDVFHSFWFTFLLLLFAVNLITCTVRRILSGRTGWGFLFAHASILLMLTGAVTSSLFSERGVLFLARGQSTDLYITHNGMRPLGFTVYLEDFSIVRDTPRSAPTDFRSTVLIRHMEKEALHADIVVNRPLRYGGYSLYQSFYDPARGAWTGIQVVRDPGLPFMYTGFGLLNAGICMMVIAKFKGGLSHALH